MATPAATPAPIRLAPVTQPGASLYNSYHFITQVSGLYAAAGGFDPDPGMKPIWQELCDSAINDLGELYLTWELSLAEARGGRPVMIGAGVGEAVARACRRTHLFTTRLNIWTPMSKWVSILSLCERRWQRFLASFEAASPTIKTKLAPVRLGGKDRLSRLVGIGVRYPQIGPPPRAPSRKGEVGFAVVTDDDPFGAKVGA